MMAIINMLKKEYTSALLTKETHRELMDNLNAINIYIRNKSIANGIPVKRTSVSQAISFLVSFWLENRSKV